MQLRTCLSHALKFLTCSAQNSSNKNGNLIILYRECVVQSQQTVPLNIGTTRAEQNPQCYACAFVGSLDLHFIFCRICIVIFTRMVGRERSP